MGLGQRKTAAGAAAVAAVAAAAYPHHPRWVSCGQPWCTRVCVVRCGGRWGGLDQSRRGASSPKFAKSCQSAFFVFLARLSHFIFIFVTTRVQERHSGRAFVHNSYARAPLPKHTRHTYRQKHARAHPHAGWQPSPRPVASSVTSRRRRRSLVPRRAPSPRRHRRHPPHFPRPRPRRHLVLVILLPTLPLADNPSAKWASATTTTTTTA